jgi:hypothetical protein
MTRDDILRMVRDAREQTMKELPPNTFDLDLFHERFFKLAYEAGAATERGRLISEGWRQCAQGQKTTQFCAVAEQVRAEEREACAQECDKIERRKWETVMNGGAMQGIGARDCAAAIRARGQQRPEPTYPSDPIWREQKRLEMEAWARDKLARHGIQIPEDDDANPSF